MTDPDPPLFDALRAVHGLNPRHRLREDHVSDIDPFIREGSWPPVTPEPPHPDPTVYGLPPDHVYAADDDPAGPPSPPLGEELGREAPACVVELVSCERCRAPIVKVLHG